MKKKLDLDLLYTLTVVAETESLKEAAKKIFKSHSAVSMQIKRLEEITGCKLICRQGQKIVLTEKAQKLVGYAKNMISLNNFAIDSLNENCIKGEINFGMPTNYSTSFIKYVLPELRNKLPNLKLNIVCAHSRKLRKLIKLGSIDAAIVTGESGILDDEFLWSESLSWVSNSSYKHIPNEKWPVAIFDEDCRVRDLLLSSLKNYKIEYEQVFLSPILGNITEAVKEGLCIALLPESSFKKFDYKILPKKIIENKELLNFNFIANDSVDDKIFELLVKNIKNVFLNNKPY